MNQKMISLLSVAALCTALTACTADSEDTAKSASTPSDVTATDLSKVETVPEIADTVPEKIKADGKLTVGDNIYYAPAEFYASDGVTAQGYDIDLAKALAKVMGLEADVQQSEFASIIPGIGSKYETGIANFSITPERIKTVNMIQYYEGGSSWSVAKGNPSGFDPANPCGAIVGVQTGTYQDTDLIPALNEKCPADNQMQVQQSEQQSDVTTALAGGKIEAMYTDTAVGDYAAKITDGQTEVIGEPSEVGGFGIVTAKDDAEFTAAMQKALQALIDQGVLQEIFSTWGITDGVSTEAVLNPSA